LVNLARGIPPVVNLVPDLREAAAERVARRRGWQRAQGVGLWGRGEWEKAKGTRAGVRLYDRKGERPGNYAAWLREVEIAAGREAATVIPGVRVIVAKSKVVAGQTVQLESTLPSGTAEAARGRGFRVNDYAVFLIARSEARRAFGCVW
jgi:hypothetical protein